MLADFLKTFAVTTAIFFLFFYSTPYWTGAEMEDLMHNGIYRAFYVFCSKTGYWAYRLIERLSAGICSLLGKKGKSGRFSLMVYTLLTLCLLAGSIMGLQQFYEYLFQDMFAVGDGINVSNEHSLLNWFSDLFIFFKLTAGYLDGTFLGFFRAIGKALLMCMAYFWGTMIYFSFLYGLLRQKVVPIKEPREDSAQDGGNKSLLDQCVDGVKSAAGKICYLRYFKVPGTLPPFLLIVAVYSLVQVWMGQEAESGALFMKIINSTGIIDLIKNFIVNFIMGKLFYCACIPVYQALPEAAKATIKDLSDRCETWARKEKERREEWTEGNDFLQNPDAWAAREQADFEPPQEPDPEDTAARDPACFGPSRKMDLFGKEDKK